VRPIGIAVNPASGKDVRRLVARASVFDNQEKCAIVRRAIVGALGAGAREFVYVPDSHRIAESAFAEFGGAVRVRTLDAPQSASALDTTRGAEACREAGCAVVITLGGDGTNRAFVKGWADAPLLPISTGTNNVFPHLVEATVAGAAAGLISSGRIALTDCALRVKRIDVDIDGETSDLALIDVVLSTERFVGARALLEADRLVLAVLTRADPAAVGMTAIGGLVRPTPAESPEGLLIELGDGGRPLDAPIAPGLYQTVRVRAARRLRTGEPVEVTGPGVLAFDGERERVLKPGQRAQLRLIADGPWVVDVRRALELGACRGAFFQRGASDREDTADAG
jgi:predicted polyphosphate/ATP-dependent NAD kinase